MSDSLEGMPVPAEDGRSLARVAPAPPAVVGDSPAGGPAPIVLAGDLPSQLRVVRDLTTIRPGTAARRALFMWLRIFHVGVKPNGKHEQVNMRIPIPFPLIGLFLPWRMSNRRALAAVTALHEAPDGAALQRALDSYVAFEFLRVEEHNPATGKSELVVIGLE